MEPEKIVQQFNNVEWDSNGDPLYSYDQMLNAVKQALQQTACYTTLPLAELQELKNTVNVLLLFAESDGEIVNGYRTKEIVQELKKLCGNDR